MAILKKKYFDVKLEIFDTLIPLLTYKPEDLEKRTIKFDLTKILRGKNCQAKFIIKKRNDKLIGELYEFKISQSYIRRLIGHNISIVEDSFACATKDKDTTIRIKPFIITRKRVHRTVRKALRNGAREFIKKVVSSKTREEIFKEVISSTFQRQLSKKLKKIYPLAVCEIRIVKVEKLK